MVCETALPGCWETEKRDERVELINRGIIWGEREKKKKPVSHTLGNWFASRPGRQSGPVYIHSCPLPHVTRVTHTLFHVFWIIVWIFFFSKETKDFVFLCLDWAGNKGPIAVVLVKVAPRTGSRKKGEESEKNRWQRSSFSYRYLLHRLFLLVGVPQSHFPINSIGWPTLLFTFPFHFLLGKKKVGRRPSRILCIICVRREYSSFTG